LTLLVGMYTVVCRLEKGRNMAETHERTDPEAKDVKKSKAKVPEGPMEIMTIRVDGDLKDQLQSVAAQDGKTPSEVSREILEKSLSAAPDRQRAALLRSLAITKAQLEAVSKHEQDLPWFKRRPFTKVIGAIVDLEEFLQEA